MEFEQIFYISFRDHKYKPTKVERLTNNGFDDSDGYYKIVSNDHLNYRY